MSFKRKHVLEPTEDMLEKYSSNNAIFKEIERKNKEIGFDKLLTYEELIALAVKTHGDDWENNSILTKEEEFEESHVSFYINKNTEFSMESSAGKFILDENVDCDIIIQNDIK